MSSSQPPKILLPENSRVVQSKYLEKQTSKKDLVRRFRNLLVVLRDEEQPVEAESDEWPGLASVGGTIVGKFLKHSDKEVRLYSVLCSIEILAIYAPEVPFDEHQVLDLFRQLTRQLGNLTHCSDNTTMKHYTHILSELADVRIGAILVDLVGDDIDNEAAVEAVEVLHEFIHTLLHSVRREHSAQTIKLVQRAIIACLDEYNPHMGASYPVVILDELLKCIGQGHLMWVIDTSKQGAAATKSKSKTKGVPQKQVPNPIYMCAATVIRSLLNKIADPISQLLTGLFAGEEHLLSQSSILGGDDDIYNIVFELHRVAPQILTTVIGTVANGLHNAASETRAPTVDTLGRLFATSDLLAQFHACFREWLGRKNDVDLEIRKSVVKHCMAVLQHCGNDEACETLVHMVTNDPSIDVRLDAIHLVCDWAFHNEKLASIAQHQQLLMAVGSRVSAKPKQERRDAVTGLAHIYARQFIQRKLSHVVQGGDDCDLAVILTALHETCQLSDSKRRDGSDNDDDPCGWVPTKVLECVYFTDQADTEMRSRVVQIFDGDLLGKKLTPTAHAVAITSVLDSLGGGILTGSKSRALQFLHQLLGQRSLLQKTLSRYIDLRAETRECGAGTEERLVADAKAMEVLENIAKLTGPVDGGKASLEDVLDAFHNARDKHIFRYLATVTNPAHAAKARVRALEELPKRCKSLGDVVSEWVKNLVKRCAMGNSLNAEVVHNCIQLAQECFREGDVPACGALLATVKTAVDIFPSVCSSGEDFGLLTELFSECRAAIGETKKELTANGIVTALSAILSTAASSQSISGVEDIPVGKKELKSQLTQLCTRDGTPEQARNAVYTLARLLNPTGNMDSDSTEEFSSLLMTLTSASRLKISTDAKEAGKVVSILSALSALTDCVPVVLTSSTRGAKVVKFSLETILLGRDNSEEGNASDDDSENEALTPSASARKKRRNSSASKKQHKTPEAKPSLLEDESLSLTCRRICAAVDFLVSHFRSTTIAHRLQKMKKLKGTKMVLPQSSQVGILFQLLTQIVKDQGLPPSNRDRKQCRSRQDRAALRICSATNLLKLCDGRLSFEKEHLSDSMWHTLSEAFLDEERAVREAVLQELGLFLQGGDVYGLEKSKLPPQAPSLRFVSLIVLCSDGDRDHDVANGCAANVGKAVSLTRSSALGCTINMRKVSSATFAQFSAQGKAAEERYENMIKIHIMPEYIVPYAFHLLSHRRETPAEGGLAPSQGIGDKEDSGSDNEETVVVRDENQHRILRKRLKLLFDPLVQSLGTEADNLSFLLRMTEVLSKHYSPVDVIQAFASDSSTPKGRLSIESTDSEFDRPRQTSSSKKMELDAKLKAICIAARDVLLSFVKSDANLNTYPGKMQLPASLFKRTDAGTIRVSQQSFDMSEQAVKKTPTRRASRKIAPKSSSSNASTSDKAKLAAATRSSPRNKKKSPPSEADCTVKKTPTRPAAATKKTAPSSSISKAGRGVHFSPDVRFPISKAAKAAFLSDSPESKSSFGALSPIPKSRSPKSLQSDDSTLGATPPVGLTATMRDAEDTSVRSAGASDEESEASVSPSSTGRNKTRSSQSSCNSAASSKTSVSPPRSGRVRDAQSSSQSSSRNSASAGSPTVTMAPKESPRSSASAVSFSQDTAGSNSLAGTSESNSPVGKVRRGRRKRVAPSPADDENEPTEKKNVKANKKPRAIAKASKAKGSKATKKRKSEEKEEMDELDFGYDEALSSKPAVTKKKKPLAALPKPKNAAKVGKASRRRG